MNQKSLKALEQTIRSDYDNITGLIIQKNGNRVYEHYFNGYTASDAVHVFSVTKSIISLLMGIAASHGCLGTDQKVLDFFPEYTVLPGEHTIQNITVAHLLTMTAPYKYVTEPYEHFFESPNPIHDALDLLGGDSPAGSFHYAAIGGPQILSGILARATGKPVLDFAKEHLFSALDIYVPHSVKIHSREEHFAVMNDRNTCGWAVDPQGNNTAGWGLFLRPADMAKLGQLTLNQGIWNGRQIVPSAWIRESTKEHSRCPQWGNLGYGYLWWIIDSDSHAAMGDGGNVIYVNTKKQMVVSIASLFAPDVKDRIRLIKELIEPMF